MNECEENVCVQKVLLISEVQVDKVHETLTYETKIERNIISCAFLHYTHHCYLQFPDRTGSLLTFMCSFLGIDPNIVYKVINLNSRPQGSILADARDTCCFCHMSV